MKEEYDFSKGQRGKFHRPGAKRIAAANELLEAIPRMFPQLIAQQSHGLREMTSSQVKAALAEKGDNGSGIYLICRKENDVPVYVGRTGNLKVRIGVDHRSTDTIATVTTKIAAERAIDKKQARELLFQDYIVKMMGVRGYYAQVILEAYASSVLKPCPNEETRDDD